MSDCSWIKHVPYAQIEEHEAAGWRVIHHRADHHNGYPVAYMEYDGDGDPPWMSERIRFKAAADRVAEARERGNEAEIAEAMAGLSVTSWNLAHWILREG